MAATARLSAQDREFFELVARAAFANPFSDERVEIDLRIAGAPGPLSQEDRLRLLIPRVTDRLARFDAGGKVRLDAYGPEDRERIESALLFGAYHRWMEEFDRLMVRQVEAGDEPCPVPFAKKALLELRKQGFSAEDAPRYFAMLYQMRRAYSFIREGLLGKSRSMKELRRRLWNNVITHDIRLYARHLMDRMEDFSTLLLGETGTGKGTAAAAIGRSGWIPFDERRGCFAESFTRAFVQINLSQYPESLIESELFGHRKGAFTGATESHEGIFSRCSSHGAIFLDEIGEVRAPVQIKLLQVLQERVFSPVGSHERMRFRGRVVAATNRPLEELRAPGSFRDDFYYRLCSDIITVPPLRQRIEEEPEELDDMLSIAIRRMVGMDSPDLVPGVKRALAASLPPRYSWPGNVRELEQCVRRILLTGRHEPAMPAGPLEGLPPLLREVASGSLDARAVLAAYCRFLFERHGTHAEVARRTRLDRRTVKRYIEDGQRG